MTGSWHPLLRLPAQAVGAWLLLQASPSAPRATDVTFRHQERGDGETWVFRRESKLELHTQAFLAGEPVVDQTDRRELTTERRVERRRDRGAVRDGWRVSIPGTGEGPPPTPFEVFEDRGALYFWFEPPTPLFDDAALREPAGIPYTQAESTLLRAAGLTAQPALWNWIPEGPMAIGTTLVVPRELAETLLASEDLEVRSMELTLIEAGDPRATFQVRARLEGRSEAGRTNAIPSLTEVDLAGTWVIDTTTTRPVVLDLGGPMQVSGQGRQEDLAVRIAASGRWTLRLSWTDEG